MRHKKKGNHLGRTASHKKALMCNMAAQVIEHKQIKTTEAKAKELRGYVDRLITYGKKGSVHHRRLAFKFLQNKQVVTSLFDEVATACQDRNGGYTRIVKLGNRKGDAATVVVFQLVDFQKSADTSKPSKAAKKESKKVTPKEEVAEVKAEKVEPKTEEEVITPEPEKEETEPSAEEEK